MASCEVHYVLEGAKDGPVVVLSPSLGTDLSMWDAQAADLDQRFRVLRHDLRGHGASPVPRGPYSIPELAGDLMALLDRLELERASLCGISIGGMIGIWIAAHAPERVERLALCCTSALLDPEGTYRARAATVRERGVGAVANGVLARWFTPALGERDPGRLATMREMLLATPPEGYAGCCEALAGMDIRAELPMIDAPTLVIAGAQDTATPPEHGRLIAGGIRGARLETVDGAAHLANVEQPTLVGELILGFLAATKEEAR